MHVTKLHMHQILQTHSHTHAHTHTHTHIYIYIVISVAMYIKKSCKLSVIDHM